MPVGHAESRSRVRDAGPATQPQEPGQIARSHPANSRGLEATGSEIAGTDHQIGGSGNDGPQRGRQVLRVMLPVAVDLSGNLVSMLASPQISRLDGAADAEVDGQRQDQCPRFSSDRCGRVGRPIIDDADVP